MNNYQPTSRRRFGQNFLCDQHVLDDLVRAIDPKPQSPMLEIGPGRGALTRLLIRAGVSLTALELDRDLVVLLREQITDPGFRLVAGDALRVDYAELMQGTSPWRIVGNLPYNISTPLLFRLLEFADRILDMHFLLQREVVQRLCAPPGCKAYGRLSVMTQHLCEVEGLFDVHPRSFRPPPKVMSQLVRLRPRRGRRVDRACDEALDQVLRTAFSQRRKTLRRALESLFEPATLSELGINPSRRPDTLAVAEFLTLANHLATRKS